MYSEPQILESNIASVTVFQDRAEVTRIASVSLEAGSYTLCFDLLPEHIEKKSIQVSGAGTAAILNQVKLTTEYYEENPEEAAKVFKKKRDELDDERRRLKDQLQRLRGQQTFLQGMANQVTQPAKGQSAIGPGDWLKMLQFYQTKHLKTDEAIHQVQQALLKNDHAMDKVEADGRLFIEGIHQAKRKVTVQVQVTQTGILELSLSYVVYDAQWEPYYDLRVFTETGEMEMTYQALIRQNTGEPWENVSLKLSTAKPQIGGRQPDLAPWRIQVYTPPVPKRTLHIAKQISRPKKSDASMLADKIPGELGITEEEDWEEGESEIGLATEDAYKDTKPDSLLAVLEQEADLETVNKPQTMDRSSAKVGSGGTAVFFEVQGKHTVKSDHTDHQVSILKNTFAIDLQYSAVPKLSDYTYLRARATNNTEYPLLAGSTNVFLNNNFVANASIDTIAPTESFWTFLGIDEGVRVERKFLKKYERKDGHVFSKKTKNLVYEYLLEVKNFKAGTVELIIKDQLPISQNDQIKVALLAPAYTKDSEVLKINKVKELEWSYKLEPDQLLEIPFIFSVTHPNDVWLLGIE